MQITVSYKRLETVGPFCNVEVSASATQEADISIEDLGDYVASRRGALKAEIDQAIAEAKVQKRAELELATGDHVAGGGYGDPDDGGDSEDDL